MIARGAVVALTLAGLGLVGLGAWAGATRLTAPRLDLLPTWRGAIVSGRGDNAPDASGTGTALRPGGPDSQR